MVKIKLQEILEKEERSLNWVATKTGISYSTLHKLNNGETKSISFDVLERICLLLKIDVSELIEIKQEGTR
ncbi:putative transcriptional regulator [Clostridium sartagoforme AAU1]|uniref:Putative transcriptional regulator n=1 Tax=Clostridium sartagoforme AAU1 TaxID=1202534 RepID=R9CDR1_9CLOT|nr:helix-turn-helix transcriptional regulator [Clostridium sartagoforme]EOR27393.1 putative transcriptional regulator [Clostridium sartagoforme AAU1]